VSLEESWSVNGEEQESWSTRREPGGGRTEWNNSAVGQCWKKNLGQNLGQTRRRRRIVNQSLSLALSLFLSFGGRKEGIWVDSEELGDAWVGILLIKEHIPSNFG
jgi:hypothetical protein